MAKRKFLLGMLVMVLAFGVTFFGCATSPEKAKEEFRKLAFGTWYSKADPSIPVLTITSDDRVYSGNRTDVAAYIGTISVQAGTSYSNPRYIWSSTFKTENGNQNGFFVEWTDAAWTNANFNELELSCTSPTEETRRFTMRSPLIKK